MAQVSVPPPARALEEFDDLLGQADREMALAASVVELTSLGSPEWRVASRTLTLDRIRRSIAALRAATLPWIGMRS